ncbi:hypothetical protein GH733_002519 [Mirounga leonina]|nr:hypothetical protein GH733_002519 [Mirounga leonina]
MPRVSAASTAPGLIVTQPQGSPQNLRTQSLQDKEAALAVAGPWGQQREAGRVQVPCEQSWHEAAWGWEAMSVEDPFFVVKGAAGYLEQKDELLELVSGSTGVLKNESQPIGGELEELAVYRFFRADSWSVV